MPIFLNDAKVFTTIALLASLIVVASCQRSEPSVSLEPAPVLTLTETVRIGDEAAGDTMLFDNVYNVTADSKGRVYVEANQVYGIPVFSGEGGLIRQIGREGAGPGEFEFEPGMYIGPRDSVYAFDMGSDRLTIFSPDDFEVVSTVTIGVGATPESTPWGILATTPDGLLMEYGVRRPERITEVKLVDWSGHIVRDSLARLPLFETVLVEFGGGSTTTIPREFGRESFFSVGADRLIYFGWNEDIDVKAVTPEGNLAREFTVPYAKVPLSSADKAATLERRSDMWRAALSRDMPDTKPAYMALLADDKGGLWIKLSWPEGALETTWLVLDGESGAIVATTTLPVHVDLYAIRGGKAYGTIDDEETGVELVAVWNIVP